jgi:hypothetical protein
VERITRAMKAAPARSSTTVATAPARLDLVQVTLTPSPVGVGPVALPSFREFHRNSFSICHNVEKKWVFGFFHFLFVHFYGTLVLNGQFFWYEFLIF